MTSTKVYCLLVNSYVKDLSIHSNRLLKAKFRNARRASHQQGFRVSYLTVGQTRQPCQPCGKMGLVSGTVVVALNQLWNLRLICSWQHSGYVVGFPSLNLRFDTVEMPNLFCLAATELVCANDRGDYEVMCRWCWLTLAECEGLMMWARWSWSM